MNLIDSNGIWELCLVWPGKQPYFAPLIGLYNPPIGLRPIRQLQFFLFFTSIKWFFSRECLYQVFLEHPLRSSRKNMKLAPNSRVFPELELRKLDAFSTTRWWSWWSSWSGALPNMLYIKLVDGQMFCFLENFYNFSCFLGCPSRILGGFMWRLQKEPPINNSKILSISSYFLVREKQY